MSLSFWFSVLWFDGYIYLFARYLSEKNIPKTEFILILFCIFRFVERLWVGLDEGSWRYELNPRLSDDQLSLDHKLTIQQNGELFLHLDNDISRQNSNFADFRCQNFPALLSVNAWSVEGGCAGLVYLTYPLLLTNSSCPVVNKSTNEFNYYGLVCAQNRQTRYTLSSNFPERNF